MINLNSPKFGRRPLCQAPAATLLPTILSTVGGALVTKALVGKNKAAAPAPAPETAVMPTSDDAAVGEAKRRRAAEIQARAGRQSTVLTDGETLGG